MSNKLGRVSRAGFVVSSDLGAGRVSRDPAAWSPMISDHERQGLRGCHALRMVSYHERNGAGRVSRCSGPW